MFLGRRLQIVYLPQFSPNIPVGLLPSHLILVIVPYTTCLTTFALYFQHIRNIHLMRSMMRHLVTLVSFRVLDTVSVVGVAVDYAVETW